MLNKTGKRGKSVLFQDRTNKAVKTVFAERLRLNNHTLERREEVKARRSRSSSGGRVETSPSAESQRSVYDGVSIPSQLEGGVWCLPVRTWKPWKVRPVLLSPAQASGLVEGCTREALAAVCGLAPLAYPHFTPWTHSGRPVRSCLFS
jgi:hypothetical protein